MQGRFEPGRQISDTLCAVGTFRIRLNFLRDVEHIHVYASGQAIVGNVETPGGGVQSKSKE